MENTISNISLVKTKPLFLNKNFILLFLGKLVSQLGDNIYNIAIAWYILAQTGSAFYMAAYLATGKATYILISPFSGVVSDQFDRKKIIYSMDLIRGVFVVGLAVMVSLQLSSSVILLGLFMTSIVINACGSLFNPTTNAAIPQLIEQHQLTKANSSMMFVDSLCNIIGAIIGAVLYVAVGIYVIIIINAISYLLSGFSELFISIPKRTMVQSEEESKSFRKELRMGYQFLRKEKGLYAMVWFSFFINFLTAPLYTVYLPYIFNQIMETDPTKLSYVQTSIGVGIILGSIVIGALPQKEKVYKHISLVILFQLVPLLIIGVTYGLYDLNIFTQIQFLIIYIVCFGSIGFNLAMMNIPIGVLIQKTVPNELLGRVGALTSMLVMAAMPLGMLMGGLLTDVLPMTIVLSFVFLSNIIANTLFWFNPNTKKM